MGYILIKIIITSSRFSQYRTRIASHLCAKEHMYIVQTLFVLFIPAYIIEMQFSSHDNDQMYALTQLKMIP